MKYELTTETIEVCGKTLHRIKAVNDISEIGIKKGDLGGFVESESNLSQEGTCWVYGLARVYGSATVSGSAAVYDSATVSGIARVYNTTAIFDSAIIAGDVKVSGDVKVCGNAEVREKTDIFTVTPIGSRNDTTTFYKTKDGKIFVKCGCKNTDIDSWLKMVQETHGENKHAKVYELAAKIAKLQILGKED